MLSFKKAAEKHGVPKTTLFRKSKQQQIAPVGSPTTFSSEDELEIVEAIEVAAEWGYPLTPLDVRLIVKAHLDSNKINIPKFKNNLPGKSWFYGFSERHKSRLSQRKSQSVKRGRSSVSHDDINQFFDNFESAENVPPENQVNYDETNLCDDPGEEKVLVRRSAKHADRCMDTSKCSTSIMFAGAASGTLLPPYVVYKADHLYDTWTCHGPTGTVYNRSKSGWFDMELFEDWFVRIPLPYFKSLKNDKPRLLIGDNVSSHLSVKVIELCKQNNIRFVFLPPNTTHLTQPLDVGFFRPFKSAWKIILKEWKLKNRGVISKAVLPSLLKKALDSMKCGVSDNLKAGRLPNFFYILSLKYI